MGSCLSVSDMVNNATQSIQEAAGVEIPSEVTNVVNDAATKAIEDATSPEKIIAKIQEYIAKLLENSENSKSQLGKYMEMAKKAYESDNVQLAIAYTKLITSSKSAIEGCVDTVGFLNEKIEAIQNNQDTQAMVDIATQSLGKFNNIKQAFDDLNDARKTISEIEAKQGESDELDAKLKEFCGEGMDEAALQAEMDKICNELKAEAEAEVLKEAPVVPETAPAEEAAPAPAEEKAPAEEEATPEENIPVSE